MNQYPQNDKDTWEWGTCSWCGGGYEGSFTKHAEACLNITSGKCPWCGVEYEHGFAEHIEECPNRFDILA